MVGAPRWRRVSFAGVKTFPPGKGIYGFARAWRPAGAQGGGVVEKAWNTRCEGIVTPPMETFFFFALMEKGIFFLNIFGLLSSRNY